METPDPKTEGGNLIGKPAVFRSYQIYRQLIFGKVRLVAAHFASQAPGFPVLFFAIAIAKKFRARPGKLGT